MNEDIHEYEGEDVDVTWDGERCIHARDCVRGLPEVFDTSKRPWVDPDEADADAVAATVTSCPTGALQYERSDGGPAERPPRENTMTVEPDGPLYLHGDLEIVHADGETLLEDTRVALCRCGASENKPLCDGSHEAVDFEDDGNLPASEVDGAEDGGEGTDTGGTLTLTPTPDGPVRVDGSFRLVGAGDRETVRRASAELCRCGASGNRPFCDYSHLGIDFSTGGE